jgi:hypothetical protein
MKQLLAMSWTVLLLTAGAAAAADAVDQQAVERAVVEGYIEGIHRIGDPERIRQYFHPDFVMYVLTDGEVSEVTRDEWIERIEKSRTAAHGGRPKVDYRLEVLDLTGTVAVVKVELDRDGRHTFTDYLSLYRGTAGWQIISKVFYHHRP